MEESAETPASPASGTHTPLSDPAAPSSSQVIGTTGDSQPLPQVAPIPDQEQTLEQAQDQEQVQSQAQSPAQTMPAQTPPAKKNGGVECISMQLDAFVLNEHIFSESYYVAPLSIPDHSSFLPGVFSSPDVVPHVDVEAAYPWHQNSRIADITKMPPPVDHQQGPGEEKKEDSRLRTERLGVYLHWCLPRQFRGASTSDSEEPEDAGKGGTKTPGASGDSDHVHGGVPGDLCPTCGRPWYTGSEVGATLGADGHAGSGTDAAGSGEGGGVTVSTVGS